MGRFRLSRRFRHRFRGLGSGLLKVGHLAAGFVPGPAGMLASQFVGDPGGHPRDHKRAQKMPSRQGHRGHGHKKPGHMAAAAKGLFGAIGAAYSSGAVGRLLGAQGVVGPAADAAADLGLPGGAQAQAMLGGLPGLHPSVARAMGFGRHRRMNPMNIRAARRAATRLKSAERHYKTIFKAIHGRVPSVRLKTHRRKR